jgi:hypothetical protein
MGVPAVTGCRCVACRTRDATIDDVLCTVCFNQIAVPCYGKVPHRRLTYARKAAEATPEPNDSAYECPVCSLYHIGKITTTSRSNTERARAVIRAIRTNGYGWILTILIYRWRYADRQLWKAKGTIAYRRNGNPNTTPTIGRNHH